MPRKKVQKTETENIHKQPIQPNGMFWEIDGSCIIEGEQ